MGRKLYVGNLPYSYTSQHLEEMFSPHGAVTSAQVIVDRVSNQSRGFGFVEMQSEQEADKAIEALNGTSIGGRSLTVNVARDRAEGGPGGGGGRSNRGGGGGFDRGGPPRGNSFRRD
ncbi:MAG: RNA-binding protein [Rhodospirillaceae bacterium]|nr:RNA-binding protein [Rhodospirillaceae bacterium]